MPRRLPSYLLPTYPPVSHDPARAQSVEWLMKLTDVVCKDGSFAATSVNAKLVITEVGWEDARGREVPVGSAEEDGKTMIRVCWETVVEKGWCNVIGLIEYARSTVSGGCASHIFDLCTSVPVVMADRAPGCRTINLTTSFLAGATAGTRLRIVACTTSVGRFIAHVKGEMWDLDRDVLIATCTHSMLRKSDKARL
ncbi:hypothetical protein RQP46_007623 [Phenoliferia psychrophenolica]